MTDNVHVHWSEYIRSLVRPITTFLVVGTYLGITSYTIWVLLDDGQTDNALALLSGVAGIATGIVGFWFGSRGAGGVKQSLVNEDQTNTPEIPIATANGSQNISDDTIVGSSNADTLGGSGNDDTISSQ